MIVLNSSQKEASDWNEGPLLVLAGPGSGKTTVLTQRIIRILKESPDERFRVLALTFTQNAARHMRDKIDHEVSEQRERAYLTTFHSFCADIIRQHGNLEKIRTDFNIMTMDVDREELLLEVINELIKEGRNFVKEDVKFLPKINSFIEKCLVIKEDVIDDDTDLDKSKILFNRYLDKMRISGRIDYSGLLYFAWILLDKKQVSKHYNIVYRYICVDEYQDTNYAQFSILTKLAKRESPNLFIVADDDQIVYQWNGASPERLYQIIDLYKMTVKQLPENYRCPDGVVNIANQMISHNTNRYAEKEKGISFVSNINDEVVRVKHFSDFSSEIKWISSDMKLRNLKSDNTKIMGRTRKILTEAQVELEKNNIVAAIHQRKSEFDSPPLRFLHSFLRLLQTRADKVQLQRLLASFYQIEGIQVDYHDVIGSASLAGGDLLISWLKIVQEKERLSNASKIFLNKINVDKWLIDYENAIESIFILIGEIYSTEIHNPEIFDLYFSEKEVWENLRNDIKMSISDELTLSGFLQELDLRDKSEPVPNDAFELITIHGAKGLEFDHVYLIGMVNDILPSYSSIKNGAKPESLEEERRSCYVAITRTQKTLTMTYSSKYWGWAKRPSLFLHEMGVL